jgi:hypothetical protein
MNIIENKKLTETLGITIGVDEDTGIIFSHKDGKITDVTNDILELAVLAIEDNQTFILFDRAINISVKEIEIYN